MCDLLALLRWFPRSKHPIGDLSEELFFSVSSRSQRRSGRKSSGRWGTRFSHAERNRRSEKRRAQAPLRPRRWPFSRTTRPASSHLLSRVHFSRPQWLAHYAIGKSAENLKMVLKKLVESAGLNAVDIISSLHAEHRMEMSKWVTIKRKALVRMFWPWMSGTSTSPSLLLA